MDVSEVTDTNSDNGADNNGADNNGAASTELSELLHRRLPSC
jgi:hypothetical protein